MNTTERILHEAGDPKGCREFLWVVHKNNPLCGYHWQACIENNPGGTRPNNNPTEWDDMVADSIAYAA